MFGIGNKKGPVFPVLLNILDKIKYNTADIGEARAALTLCNMERMKYKSSPEALYGLDMIEQAINLYILRKRDELKKNRDLNDRAV